MESSADIAGVVEAAEVVELVEEYFVVFSADIAGVVEAVEVVVVELVEEHFVVFSADIVVIFVEHVEHFELVEFVYKAFFEYFAENTLDSLKVSMVI